MKIRILISVSLLALLFIGLEIFLYNSRPAQDIVSSADVNDLLGLLPEQPTTAREQDNQFLIHNLVLFNSIEDKGSIDTGFIGTSRSKMLRPSWIEGIRGVNASGNSYNEITYGTLIQAEMLRLSFPNLKTLYIETSFLLRRPDRLIVEEDHKKYLPYLESLWPLRNDFSYLKAIELNRNKPVGYYPGYYLLNSKENIQALNVFKKLMHTKNTDTPLLAKDAKFLLSLNSYGERIDVPSYERDKKDQPTSIQEDHIKVQRLRDITSWGQWDGLFDVIAEWGKQNNIIIHFYEPPVRSDLYSYQLKYGLNRHRESIEETSKKYGLAYINLNTPELGLQDRWELFSDEDHLETCHGIAIYTSSLILGRNYKDRGEMISQSDFRNEVLKLSNQLSNKCKPN